MLREAEESHFIYSGCKHELRKFYLCGSRPNREKKSFMYLCRCPKNIV